MSAETDRLRTEFEDAVKCGRTDHAQKVLAERDALILAERAKGKEMARCDNCLVARPTEDLNEIKDYHQRVEPGGIVPSGECPDCGALAYPVPEFELYPNDSANIVYQGTPVYGQHLVWIPIVTHDGQVGLAIKGLGEKAQEEYLYFNPSIDERNVFVYHGSELSVVQDGTECFIDVAVDWDK